MDSIFSFLVEFPIWQQSIVSLTLIAATAAEPTLVAIQFYKACPCWCSKMPLLAPVQGEAPRSSLLLHACMLIVNLKTPSQVVFMPPLWLPVAKSAASTHQREATATTTNLIRSSPFWSAPSRRHRSSVSMPICWRGDDAASFAWKLYVTNCIGGNHGRRLSAETHCTCRCIVLEELFLSGEHICQLRLLQTTVANRVRRSLQTYRSCASLPWPRRLSLPCTAWRSTYSSPLGWPPDQGRRWCNSQNASGLLTPPHLCFKSVLRRSSCVRFAFPWCTC